MGKSINRDIYYQRALSKSDKDENALIKFLSISPYKQHKQVALKMLQNNAELKQENL